ncbi:MAG: GtrA family protein, partial [Pseudorhodoplanes sp.]
MNDRPEPTGALDRLILTLRRQVLMLKAISFAMIGVINALVDFAVFLFALEFVTPALPGENLQLIAANVLAWMVAVSGSYAMNSYVTFAAESGRKLTWRAYLTFVASGILGVVANTGTLLVAAIWLPVILAKIVAIGVGFVVNFSMSHFVVFRPQPPKPD